MYEVPESLSRAEAIAVHLGAKSILASIAWRRGEADTALAVFSVAGWRAIVCNSSQGFAVVRKKREACVGDASG